MTLLAYFAKQTIHDRGCPIVNFSEDVIQYPSSRPCFYLGVMNKKRRIAQIGLILGIVSVAFAGEKLAPDLRDLNPESRTDVIIQYKHPPTSANHQNVADRGGSFQQEFQAVKGAVYVIPVKSLKDLEDNEEVLYVSPNRKLHSTAASMTYDYTPQSVGSFGLSPTLSDGVGVVVIDSGINSNQDLSTPGQSSKSRVVYSQSFVGRAHAGEQLVI